METDNFNFLIVSWKLEYEASEIWILQDLRTHNKSFLTDKPSHNSLNLDASIKVFEKHGNASDSDNFIAFYDCIVNNLKEHNEELFHIKLELLIKNLAFEEYKHRAEYKYKNICENLHRDIRYPLNLLLTSPQISNEDKRKTLQTTNHIFDILDVYFLENRGKTQVKPNYTLFNVEHEIQYIINAAKLLSGGSGNDKRELIIDTVFYDSLPKLIYFDAKSLKQIIINILQYCIALNDKLNNKLNCESNRIVITAYADAVASDKNHILNIIIQHSNSDIKATPTLFLPVELLEDNAHIGLRISYLLTKKLGGNFIESPNTYHLDFTISNKIESLTMKKLNGKGIQFIFSDKFNAFSNFKTLDDVVQKYKMRIVANSFIQEKKTDFIIKDVSNTILRIETTANMTLGYITSTMSEIVIKNILMRDGANFTKTNMVIIVAAEIDTESGDLKDALSILKTLGLEVIISDKNINETANDTIVYNYASQPNLLNDILARI